MTPDVTLRQLCLDKQLSANDVPDAWLAAAVAHLGEHLVSFDAGKPIATRAAAFVVS